MPIMQRLLVLLTALLAVVSKTVLAEDVPPIVSDLDPDHYSSCAVLDEGYNVADATQSRDYVVQKLIADSGHGIRTNYCYYKVTNATIVGVCNGSARNRTVTANEVERGINDIFKDCGQDSGYHVVNNLTFSAYGLIGGVKALVPKTFSYPDFPGWSDTPEVIPVR